MRAVYDELCDTLKTFSVVLVPRVLGDTIQVENTNCTSTSDEWEDNLALGVTITSDMTRVGLYVRHDERLAAGKGICADAATSAGDNLSTRRLAAEGAKKQYRRVILAWGKWWTRHVR